MIKPFQLLAVFTGCLALTACSNSNYNLTVNLVDQLNADSRFEKDQARDTGRKPAQVMAFFGIKPGMRVLDLLAAGGYYTEVLSYQVGPEGEVLSHNNDFLLKIRDGQFDKQMTRRLADDRLSNVKRFHRESDNFGLESEIDAITLVLNYHDIHARGNYEQRQAFLAGLYKALKPGGILGVIDSNAKPGANNPKLHRINSDVAKREIAAAGFTLAAESDILRNVNDAMDLMVFDPSIRGKTDRFMLKYTK